METSFIQNEVRNRKRWLVIPSAYGVVVMSGYYTEEDVLDFIKTRLMKKAEYDGNVSFTIHKVVGSVYRTTPGHMPDTKKNLFDVPAGKRLIYEKLAEKPRTVIVKKPFWMIHGEGLKENGTASAQGELVVEDESEESTICITCDAQGKNIYSRLVLKNIGD